MPSRLSWSKLLPGLVALAVVLSAALGVLLFAGIGQIRGEKIHLLVLSDQARGVMRGTEVWLAGQKVGLVDAVYFRPPNEGRAKVVIAVSVKANDADRIRRDSHAQVRPGTSLIGPVVLYLSAGTPGVRGVREGDTLFAAAQSDIELAGTKLNEATANFAPTIADARVVMASVHDTNGTIGAMLADGRHGDVAKLFARFGELREHTFDGDVISSGTTGASGASGMAGASNVMARARGALARVDSILTLVASTNNSLGRFRRDSTLVKSVAGVRDELTELQARFDSAGGNTNRLSTDSSLARSVAESRRAMSMLFDDIRRRPLRYVHF
ncbi:MAG TPA: MlaD family protein [Gemmatimonadaceae bacterium]|jgi:phospholipid/cholesterol/gamma-HCH transport system substrate-binding protein